MQTSNTGDSDTHLHPGQESNHPQLAHHTNRAQSRRTGGQSDTVNMTSVGVTYYDRTDMNLVLRALEMLLREKEREERASERLEEQQEKVLEGVKKIEHHLELLIGRVDDSTDRIKSLSHHLEDLVIAQDSRRHESHTLSNTSSSNSVDPHIGISQGKMVSEAELAEVRMENSLLRSTLQDCVDFLLNPHPSIRSGIIMSSAHTDIITSINSLDYIIQREISIQGRESVPLRRNLRQQWDDLRCQLRDRLGNKYIPKPLPFNYYHPLYEILRRASSLGVKPSADGLTKYAQAEEDLYVNYGVDSIVEECFPEEHSELVRQMISKFHDYIKDVENSFNPPPVLKRSDPLPSPPHPDPAIHFLSTPSLRSPIYLVDDNEHHNQDSDMNEE
jgi:hypothetical protein